MSYDLYFAKRNAQPLTQAEFDEYFSSRVNYQLNGSEALYGNEDTGVYFSFDLASGKELDKEAQEDDFPLVASFNLNFFRPPFFGLEAALELSGFVSHFDLVVDDPQQNGMGRGEFSEEGFLSGWNAGNRFAYKAIFHQHDSAHEFRSLPDEVLEGVWRWNIHRQQLQDQIGESAFVPKIMFFDMGGSIVSAAVWGDAIPVILPEVDVVLMVRHELAPRRIFFRRRDVAVVPWPDLLPKLSHYTTGANPRPHYKLLYQQAPEEIITFVRGLSPTAEKIQEKIQGIPPDQILSAELLSEAQSSDPPKAVELGPESTHNKHNKGTGNIFHVS